VIERSLTVSDLPEVEVRIQTGSIEVTEGPDGVVNARVVTNDPRFVVEQRGNLIVLHSDTESGWLSSKRAEVFLEVPRGTSAALRTASAEISVQVPLEKVEVKTASGDIELREAEKAIVKTASGDVTIGEVGGALRFSSASGDLMVVDGAHGTLGGSTASGDITVTESDATIELNTVSGDLHIKRYTGRHLAVKTMSGSVDVGIPTGTKVELDASLMSGRIHLPSPPDSDQGPVDPDRHMYLKVKSVSGDLSIERLPD
jgi:DUF4097 and DUF4098 domain-containing protein YvlB